MNPDDTALKRIRSSAAIAEGCASKDYEAGEVRFRNNGELWYSLQSAQRHLPFINHIYVAHAGAPPPWLKNTNKLTLVKQDDLLPKGLAPTFQSDVIECFLHRIPTLSEHYLYSNDDFFFAQTHAPSDFFDAEGKALIAMGDQFGGLAHVDPVYKRIELNTIRMLSRRLKLPPVMRVGNGRNILGIKHPRQQIKAWMRGFKLLNMPTHVTHPYKKSVWDTFHKMFAPEISQLTRTRFRNEMGFATNVSYHHYSLSIGQASKFFSRDHYYLDRVEGDGARERMKNALLKKDSPVTRFCLNDKTVDYEDGWTDYIADVMSALGYPPVPSSHDAKQTPNIALQEAV